MHKLKQAINILFITFLSTQLTACGFHMRSQTSLPAELQALALSCDNPYGTFETTLKHSLKAAGVKIVKRENAPYTLKTFKPILNTGNITTGNSNEARVYNVTYMVGYALINNATGKPILTNQIARTSRTLTLSANQLLESNNQLGLMAREMQRDIVSRIFNRLASQQVEQILKQRK